MNKPIINNPGGRKPLPDDVKRDHIITARVNTKELRRISRKAGDMPLSVYIRESALHATVRQPVTRELMKEIRALNNLGTNINSIAKLANQRGIYTVTNEARQALREVNSVLHEARLKIKEKEEEDDASVLQG